MSDSKEAVSKIGLEDETVGAGKELFEFELGLKNGGGLWLSANQGNGGVGVWAGVPQILLRIRKGSLLVCRTMERWEGF